MTIIANSGNIQLCIIALFCILHTLKIIIDIFLQLIIGKEASTSYLCFELSFSFFLVCTFDCLNTKTIFSFFSRLFGMTLKLS